MQNLAYKQTYRGKKLLCICGHGLDIQWTPLNGITLWQTITDPNNKMITITEYISHTKSMPLRDIWNLINLGHFDPINWMIPLTVIPLSSTHCSTKNLQNWYLGCCFIFNNLLNERDNKEETNNSFFFENLHWNETNKLY